MRVGQVGHGGGVELRWRHTLRCASMKSSKVVTNSLTCRMRVCASPSVYLAMEFLGRAQL